MKTHKFNHDLATFQFNEEKGIIKLDGRFISLDPEGVWGNIISNSERVASSSDRLRIDLNMEYISSSDIKFLYLLMKTLMNAKKAHAKFVVNWSYEPYDNDHLELGKLIQDSMAGNLKFQFIEEWNQAAA